MAVERVTEVLHHPEPDVIGEIRLPDPDDARHERDRDHQGHVAVEQRQIRARLTGAVVVGPEQRPVEHRDDQQRVHNAETGRDDDGEADHGDLLLVRREGSDHPTNGRRLDRPRILVERPSAHAEHASVPSHSLQRYGAPADGGGAGHASHATCDFRKLAGIEAYSVTDNVSQRVTLVTPNE